MQNLFLVLNLSAFLDEADTKKKKKKLSEHSQGGEPENHEAPAKGITGILRRGLVGVGREEVTRGLQAAHALQTRARCGPGGENGSRGSPSMVAVWL